MKSRQNVIADAALTFTTIVPRKAVAQTLVDSVLPGVAADLNKVEPFVQKTPVPRGLLKSFSAAIIERVLTKGAKLTDLTSFLLPSEVEYITLVLDEVYVWAEAQGFEVAPKGEAVAS
jgi:hypothetical protein